jgi:hypothetical protein
MEWGLLDAWRKLIQKCITKSEHVFAFSSSTRRRRNTHDPCSFILLSFSHTHARARAHTHTHTHIVIAMVKEFCGWQFRERLTWNGGKVAGKPKHNFNTVCDITRSFYRNNSVDSCTACCIDLYLKVSAVLLICKLHTFRWHSTSKLGGLWLPMSLVVQQPSNMEEQKLSDHAQWLRRCVLNISI